MRQTGKTKGLVSPVRVEGSQEPDGSTTSRMDVIDRRDGPETNETRICQLKRDLVDEVEHHGQTCVRYVELEREASRHGEKDDKRGLTPERKTSVLLHRSR